jgi:tRNA (cmo5U34)-methyltransferase
MDSSRGYDLLAPLYDALSFIAFGSSLYRAQAQFLNDIPPGSKVLVLGGGTGRWLNEASIRRSNPEITYIDSSYAMLKKAGTNGRGLSVQFVRGTQEFLKGGEDFDVFIAFCFFDLFDIRTLPDVVDRIRRSMKPGASWMVVDFVNRKWWHAAMLSTMYVFFRIITGLKNSKLPAWQDVLKAKGLCEKQSRTFYAGFIESGIWTAC